jgi:hypothetical protein
MCDVAIECEDHANEGGRGRSVDDSGEAVEFARDEEVGVVYFGWTQCRD